MNAHQISQIRQKLLHQRAELLELTEALEESCKPVILDQAAVGRLSRMDAMQGQQMALETSRRQQQQLLKITAALKRIESNEYGICFKCGDEIDSRRLDADPSNTRCVGCVPTR